MWPFPRPGQIRVLDAAERRRVDAAERRLERKRDRCERAGWPEALL